MADDFHKGVNKTLDITVQIGKLTKETLKAALQEFLSGSAEKKRQNGHETAREKITWKTREH